MAYYLLNPDGDLPDTQATFEPWLKDELKLKVMFKARLVSAICVPKCICMSSALSCTHIAKRLLQMVASDVVLLMYLTCLLDKDMRLDCLLGLIAANACWWGDQKISCNPSRWAWGGCCLMNCRTSIEFIRTSIEWPRAGAVPPYRPLVLQLVAAFNACGMHRDSCMKVMLFAVASHGLPV